MRVFTLLLMALLLSCKNNQMDKKGIHSGIIPITTSSKEAKKHFEKAQFLVQNGIDGNPTESYKKALEYDSSFVRMHNFISIYAPDDTLKKHHHELAKKFRHLASKEEQLLIDATEFRINNPDDMYEKKLFELAEACPNDKYLFHTICFLLFRKNPALAIEAGKKSVVLDSNYGSGYNILGYAYLNNKELEKAKSAFDNFIRCEPENGNPYDSKADVMLQLGNYKEALTLKQKAYELNPTFDWIPEEIKEIKATIDTLEN
ncbi:tetratricopeptide repeat protein [Aquimarina hainanensis]|uniref:Tetratricopeptide repeat protein n=1 Tax=Aquimarina hainanensis TaxID=1578017 RepID=A0ABW5N3J3_9FLAO|nr:hypothetical protein [Aquimarina sp. TRL1]QKX06092.1 hypothetical protein HN014_14635 [Aquimarina sp. TRL1]